MSPPNPDLLPVFSHAPKGPDGFDGKLIVAVHGMGDQRRNDFAQIVARLVARYFALQKKDSVQTRLLPLGAWDGGRETDVDDPAVCLEPAPGCEGLKDYAFAEVYWADIARSMETQNYRLEEPTQWARTVVERLAQRHGPGAGFGPRQFHLAGFVIEEIAETLALIQKIALAGKLFSLSKKDVDLILTQYICDVQQVGDFQRQREKFRDRFFNRMEVLHQFYPEAEIHIVAHSEGSVVALYTLLTALCERGQEEAKALRAGSRSHESVDPNKANKQELTFKWIQRVVSFSTMGSPIDKHLHLWPEIWRTFERDAGWFRRRRRIRWHNYYDYADPVGYELDSAQASLAAWGCPAFEFDVSKHDHGYRRYFLPGQAHLGYLKDDGLFAHLIENVVSPEKQKEKKPAAAPGDEAKGFLSPVIPFAVVVGLMLAAVLVLQQGLVPPKDAPSFPNPAWMKMPGATAAGLVGCWALLMGTTMLARILRLTRSGGMLLLSAGLYVGGALVFWFLPGRFALEAGYRAGGFIVESGDNYALQAAAAKIMVLAGTLLAVGVTWLTDFVACEKRWRPVWALRALMLFGVLTLGAFLVVPRLGSDSGYSAMALFGGLGGFGVLWWLGTLLFDLAFCWQRYINVEKSWLDRLWPERAKSQGGC